MGERFIYLVDKLSQKLFNASFVNQVNASFVNHYTNNSYQQDFRALFGKFIVALYNKGLRDFSSMLLHSLDLSNQTFESCNFSGSDFYCSNLENTKFIKCNLNHCGFGSSKILGLTIDKDCSLHLTEFHSELDLLEMQIFAGIKKLMYVGNLNTQEIILLSKIMQHLDCGRDVTNDSNLKDFTDIYSSIKNNNNFEHTFKSNNNEYKIFFRCLFTLDYIPLINLCGIKYNNNVIRLYNANKLFEWLKQQRQCPYKMELDYIQKNLLNLKNIKELLCQNMDFLKHNITVTSDL